MMTPKGKSNACEASLKYQDLPESILNQCFSYLPTDEVIKSRTICKLFNITVSMYGIPKSSLYFYSADFENYAKYYCSKTKNGLFLFKNIEFLTIDLSTNIGETSMLLNLKYFKKLKTLAILSNHIHQKTLNIIMNHINKQIRLDVFYLVITSRTSITGNNNDQHVNIDALYPCIFNAHSYKLQHCYITKTVLDVLNKPTLNYLQINKCIFDDNICNKKTRFNHLNHLSLINHLEITLDEVELIPLYKQLLFNTNIKKLTINIPNDKDKILDKLLCKWTNNAKDIVLVCESKYLIYFLTRYDTKHVFNTFQWKAHHRGLSVQYSLNSNHFDERALYHIIFKKGPVIKNLKLPLLNWKYFDGLIHHIQNNEKCMKNDYIAFDKNDDESCLRLLSETELKDDSTNLFVRMFKILKVYNGFFKGCIKLIGYSTEEGGEMPFSIKDAANENGIEITSKCVTESMYYQHSFRPL